MQGSWSRHAAVALAGLITTVAETPRRHGNAMEKAP
jgi:hypothetical protein